MPFNMIIEYNLLLAENNDDFTMNEYVKNVTEIFFPKVNNNLIKYLIAVHEKPGYIVDQAELKKFGLIDSTKQEDIVKYLKTINLVMDKDFAISNVRYKSKKKNKGFNINVKLTFNAFKRCLAYDNMNRYKSTLQNYLTIISHFENYREVLDLTNYEQRILNHSQLIKNKYDEFILLYHKIIYVMEKISTGTMIIPDKKVFTDTMIEQGIHAVTLCKEIFVLLSNTDYIDESTKKIVYQSLTKEYDILRENIDSLITFIQKK